MLHKHPPIHINSFVCAKLDLMAVALLVTDIAGTRVSISTACVYHPHFIVHAHSLSLKKAPRSKFHGRIIDYNTTFSSSTCPLTFLCCSFVVVVVAFFFSWEENNLPKKCHKSDYDTIIFAREFHSSYCFLLSEYKSSIRSKKLPQIVHTKKKILKL